MIAYLDNLSRYDLVAAILQALLVTAALGTALVYVTKRSGNRSSNVFFALLLSSFALSVTTLVLEHLALPARYPRFRYIPLWLTWTIGPSWFYYVKFSLFPSYRFRWSDMKHFVVPVVQVLTYAVVFFGHLRDGNQAPVQLLGVRATTIEESIFLISVVGYVLAAYRYLRYRAREIGDRRLRWEYWRVQLLRESQRALIALLAFNFAFVAYNFAATETSGVGLLHLRGFYASSSLSFGLMLVYLLRGVAYRQHFYPIVPPGELSGLDDKPALRLRHLMEAERAYRDPDLHVVRVARAVGVPPGRLNALTQQLGEAGWWPWIVRLRAAEVARLRSSGRSLRQACLEVGFASRRAALRAFKGG